MAPTITTPQQAKEEQEWLLRKKKKTKTGLTEGEKQALRKQHLDEAIAAREAERVAGLRVHTISYHLEQAELRRAKGIPVPEEVLEVPKRSVFEPDISEEIRRQEEIRLRQRRPIEAPDYEPYISEQIMAEERRRMAAPSVVFDEDLLTSLQRVYPDVFELQDLDIPQQVQMSIEAIETWARDNQLAFLTDIRAKGRNVDTESILRRLGLNDADLDEVYPLPVREEEDIERILRTGGVSEEEIEKLLRMSRVSVPRLMQMIDEEERTGRLEKPPQLYWDDITGEWTEQAPLPGVLGKISETLRWAAEAPLFTVAGQPISSSDIVAVALLGYGVTVTGKEVYRRLIHIGQTTGSRLYEVVLNKGLDKWIADQARILPEGQVLRYRLLNKLIIKNRTSIVETATENWKRRLATRVSTREAAQRATEDTIREVEAKLLPSVLERPPAGVPPRAVVPAEPIITPAPRVPLTVTPVTPAKEAWQMTQAEHREIYGLPGADAVHRSAVFGAINQGKPVSQEVLKDYPDLKPVEEVTPPVTEGVRPEPIGLGELGERRWKLGKWTISEVSKRNPLSESDLQYHSQIANWIQQNTPEMNREYWVSLGGTGALGSEQGMKSSMFKDNTEAQNYFEIGLWPRGETDRQLLRDLGNKYGAKKVADAQQMLHEIGESLNIGTETQINQWSIEQTQKFLATITPQVTPPVTEGVTETLGDSQIQDALGLIQAVKDKLLDFEMETIGRISDWTPRQERFLTTQHRTLESELRSLETRLRILLGQPKPQRQVMKADEARRLIAAGAEVNDFNFIDVTLRPKGMASYTPSDAIDVLMKDLLLTRTNVTEMLSERLGSLSKEVTPSPARVERRAGVAEVKPPVTPEVVPPAKAVVRRAGEAPPTLVDTPPETTLPMPDKVTVSEDRVVRPPSPPKEPPPSEPTPTHAPQPAPIEDNRLVMPDLQPPQQVVDMYSKPDFWRRVANLPIVKKAVGVFNPAAVANDPARQALILRAALKDEGAQKAQGVMSHLWEIGTQERVWGKTDKMGLLTTEPFEALPIDEIRTHPDKYRHFMTDKQREWIKRAEEIEVVKLDALKRNGIEINELSFEDGGRYAGRRVVGKFNDSGELIESGRIAVGGRVGARQAFEKTRVFKDIGDAIDAGYRYMNSDEALYYNTVGAYNRIADKQMSEWVLTKVDWRTTAAPETLVLQAESARLRLRKAQQLLGALNRAVRGERVPTSTLNSIASVYSDQADTLKNLIPELQKPSPETANIVQILDKEAKALISEAKLDYAQAVNVRARAREEALRVKYEEASIAHPAFQGKIFTGAEAKEIADILRAGLQPQFNEALVAVNKVNAIGRFFMLAGDVSPMTIQLQFLAFYRPVAYAKSMGGFVRAMFDPEFQYRYYANHRDLINRHPTLILSGRGTEFTEFMGRGGLGQKLGVLAKPLVPFQKAFEGCLDTAGIELAKSLDHHCTTPERTLEVDQFINEFRGLTSSARIGVSSTQRQIETALVLAPRYNRAMTGYLFDFVHGGVRGKLVRMSMAQGFAGLSAMAVAVSIALGEEEDEIWQHFDPTSPKFFTWDVMGVKIGLGGKVRSVIKTFGNMLRTGEVGQPALRFLRGNLSPVAGTGLDLVTGKNYIGEPTRDNVLSFSKTILENFMMIWTQNLLLEGGTLQDKAIIATAEFFGLRGYDISARKELKIQDLEELLGEPIGKTPVLTKKKPDIYQMNNIYSDIKRLLQYTPPEDVLADKGYAGLGHAVIKIEQSEGNNLPDIALRNYNFDKAKGDTLSDYMNQWAERQRITDAGERAEYTRVKIVEGKEERTEFKGLAALNAHKVDYPKAHLGNLKRRQRELLLEFNAATDKKQFAKDNPGINVNPQIAWFKANPKDNAEFALFGQAKIYSKEAYEHFNKLLQDRDITDSAIPEQTLPPETSIDTHFSYQEMVSEGRHGSWEAQLLLLKDAQEAEEAGIESYAEWHDLILSDTPSEALELKIKHRDLYEQYETLETDEERAKLKSDNPLWVDDMRRIEAIEGNASDVEAWVERGHIIDEFGVGSSEAKVWSLDNPDAYRWALDIGRLTDDGSDWNENVLRINVKWAKEDEEYNTLPIEDRESYLDEHEEYRKDRRRRDGYSKGIPESEIGNYVAYYDLPSKGYWQERFLVEHPELAQAMGRNIPTKVLPEEYDVLREKEDKTPEDKLRITAYEKEVPEIHLDNYVSYYSLKKPDNDLPWYEDDWWMMEHPDFYKQVYLGILGNQRKDYRKVPTRKIYAKYLKYQTLAYGVDRDQYRLDNPDLDEWAVSVGIWTTTMSERRRRLGLTPGERFEEEQEELQEEAERRLVR